MLKNWFKIYRHNAIKNKWFTFLTIIGLAIGIAGVIFSTLYWKDETSYDQWNPDKDRIYELLTEIPYANQVWSNSTDPTSRTILESTDKVLETLSYSSIYFNDVYIVNNKKEYLSKVVKTQSNFFNFFPFQFIQGDQEKFEKNIDGIAIEKNEAKRLFGNITPVNKQIKGLDGKVYTIYGVFKQNKYSSIQAKYIISSLQLNKDDWNNFNHNLLVKLKNPKDKNEVEKTINKIYYTNLVERYAKNEGVSAEEYIKKSGVIYGHLQGVTDSRLNSNVTGLLEGKGNKTFLEINLGLSVLILVLSIINYINLVTAQSLRRAKEVGIRKVLGASKKNVILQFIFETSITTIFSLLLAMAFVEIGLPYYNQLINKEIDIDFINYLPYLLSILIVCILLSGIFPAIYVSNFKELNVLKGNFSRSKNGIWLRNSMLILQFSIATFFIIGGTLVKEQVDYMSKKDLGFSGDQIINITFRRYDLGEKRYALYESIKQDLLKINGVKKINASSFKFGYKSMNSSQLLYKNKMIQIQNVPVDFGFIEMMKIKLKTGRDFDARITSDTIDHIILNESAINELERKLKVGDKVRWNDHDFKIIGIVNNFNIGSPEVKVPPMMLINFKTASWLQNNLDQVLIKIDVENSQETISSIESVWKAKVDQDFPFEYDFIDKQFARSYENYIKQEKMFKILNVIVITIALFGLFALASYTIERKYKEIAIRKVLGAETGTLLKTLSKQYIYLCIVGFLIAIVPSYFLMQKWLENFAYRIDISISVYILAFLMLLSLTLLVLLLKAYNATRINILNYLKYE